MRDAADAARAGVDRLLSHKVLRRESAGVSTESALRGARASAALEGVDVPLADLRAGAVDDPVVQGALRVSAALGSMVDTWPRAPGQVLARLHVLAAADLVDPADLGRPARTPVPGCPGCSRSSPGRPTAPGRARGRAGARRDSPRWPPSASPTAWSPARPDGSPASPAAWTPRRSRCPRSGSRSWARGLRRGAGRLRVRGPDGLAGWLVHCCRATEHGALEGLAVCESLLRG